MPVNVSLTDFQAMIEDYMINIIKNQYPEIDMTDNSPIRDLLITPLKTMLIPIITEVNSIETMKNLDNASLMTVDELNIVGRGNYMMERIGGIKAIGIVTYRFKSVSDTNNLVIPQGSIVSTVDGLNFSVVSGMSITPDELYTMYNPVTFLYEVSVNAEAENVGANYNIGEGLINTIVSSFSPYLDSVTNSTPFLEGMDDESNDQYATRIRQFYVSRQLGTDEGYSQFIYENFPEVTGLYVAGKDDPIMTRDIAQIIINGQSSTGHIGGKVDVYVRGYDVPTQSITAICESNNLLLSQSPIPNQNTIIIHNGATVLSLFTSVVNEDGTVTVTVPQKNGNVVQWVLGDTISINYNYMLSGQPSTPITDIFVIDNQPIDLMCPVADVVSMMDNKSKIQYDLSPLSQTNIALVFGVASGGYKTADISFVNPYGLTVSWGGSVKVLNVDYTIITKDLTQPWLKSIQINSALVGVTSPTCSFNYQPSYYINYQSDASLTGSSREVASVYFLEGANNGDSITLVYSYNKTINSIGLLIDQAGNRIITTDLLVREAIPVYIHIGINIKLRAYQTGDTTKANLVKNAIMDFLNTIIMGGSIEESDIVNKLYTNQSVSAFMEYVALPLTTLHRTTDINEVYVDGLRDGTYLTLGSIEYPILYICNVTWL